MVWKVCPFCRAKFLSDDFVCPSCGSQIKEGK
jgi:rRNA maturation endonuclease Nob1